MRRILLSVFLFLETGFAAFERPLTGGMTAGMGGASLAVAGNPWIAMANPGGLSSLAHRSLCLFYSPQPFGLKELARGTLSLTEPTSFGTFSLSASKYGFELYREVEFSIGYGVNVTEGIDAGIGLRHYSLSIQGYGSAATFGVDAGLLVRLTDELHWGTSALNLNAPTIGRARERLPQILGTGFSYRPVEEAILAVDLSKDLRYPLEMRFGVEYTPVSPVQLRVGSGTEPSTVSAGIGLRYQFFGLDYAFMSHPDLGGTHQFSVMLSLDEF